MRREEGHGALHVAKGTVQALRWGGEIILDSPCGPSAVPGPL